MTDISVYCDESCHLLNDGISTMLFGALWCPTNIRKLIQREIKDIKREFGLSSNFEIKWSKVSKGREDFYEALLDYFWGNDQIAFRAVVVPDKNELNHEIVPGQDHDQFYYKMNFLLLRQVLQKKHRYKIHLDIKDTRSQERVTTLHDYLCKAKYDFDRNMILSMQHVRSDEVEQQQLCDFLLGLTGYANRGLSGNEAKVNLVNRLKRLSRASLIRSTLPSEPKLNIFIWEPRQF